MKRFRWPSAMLLAAMVAVVPAAPAAGHGNGEIDALVAAMAASGCEFERNGRWYDASRARAHLQRKRDWLERRGLADTAELFIERAASASSASGKPYRVRCPGQSAQPASQWFNERLRELRGNARSSSHIPGACCVLHGV